MPTREEWLSELVELQEESAELRRSIPEPDSGVTIERGWHPAYYQQYQHRNVVLYDDGTGETFRLNQQMEKERLEREAKSRADAEKRTKRLEVIDSRIQILKKLVAPDLTATEKGTEGARDKSLEARDKWIYEQCCKWIPYQTIVLRLKKKPKKWPRISSKQGVRIAAIRYAARHDLPPVPGRSKSKRR